MKMIGSTTVVQNHEVDVDPYHALQQLRNKFHYIMDVPNDAYINKDGEWETWEDTCHGSGLYTQHRVATVAEKKLEDSFNIIRDRIKELED